MSTKTPKLKSYKILPLNKSNGETAETVRINFWGTLKMIKGVQQHSRCLFKENECISARTLGSVVLLLQVHPSLPSGGLVRNGPQSLYQRRQKGPLSHGNALFLWTCLVAPWKTRSKGLFLVPLTENSPSAKATTQGCLSKHCQVHTLLSASRGDA